MAQTTLNAPPANSMGPNTGDAPERGDSWLTVLNAINSMFAEIYAFFQARNSAATNGLYTRRIPLTSLRNGDLTVMDATGSSTKLKLAGTIGTSEDAETAAVQNTTNTCVAMAEFVIPDGYVAGQNLTLTAEMKRVVSAGTTLTTSVACNAYKMADTGAAGADICATAGAQAFTSTTGIDVPFTITGTSLNPGDRLAFKLTVVATEGGNTGTVQSVLNSLRVS